QSAARSKGRGPFQLRSSQLPSAVRQFSITCGMDWVPSTTALIPATIAVLASLPEAEAIGQGLELLIAPKMPCLLRGRPGDVLQSKATSRWGTRMPRISYESLKDSSELKNFSNSQASSGWDASSNTNQVRPLMTDGLPAGPVGIG